MEMRNRTVSYFDGKLSEVLSRNPNIQDIHELAIKALYNQKHSDINEFYLDCAIERLKVEKIWKTKKVIQNNKTSLRFSIAA